MTKKAKTASSASTLELKRLEAFEKMIRAEIAKARKKKKKKHHLTEKPHQWPKETIRNHVTGNGPGNYAVKFIFISFD
jgi:hypothetical protein